MTQKPFATADFNITRKCVSAATQAVGESDYIGLSPITVYDRSRGHDLDAEAIFLKWRAAEGFATDRDMVINVLGGRKITSKDHDGPISFVLDLAGEDWARTPEGARLSRLKMTWHLELKLESWTRMPK